MAMKHIRTVDRTLHLEVGFAGSVDVAGLSDAIIEALEKGGIIEAGDIVYIKASAPGESLMAVEIWAPEPDPAEGVEPSTIPEEDDTPEPQV